MFTGLIENIGLVTDQTTKGNYRLLTIASVFAPPEVRIGESISCNGACLTVVDAAPESFVVEMSQETIARVAASRYAPGSRINLERALRVGDRLGGHFVTGHVDGIGYVDHIRRIGESRELAVSFDARFNRYVIEKGSIAIDGISLAINECGAGRLAVNIIPHTYQNTVIGDLKAGAPVNLEFDLIGKYVLKAQGADVEVGLTIDTLLKSGW